jgi:pilus assembly protein CpaC
MGTHAQSGCPDRRRIRAAILIIAIVVGAPTLYAQSPAQSLTARATAETSASPVEPAADSLRLLVGRSTIVDVGKPIARVSLTSSDIADALVTSPNELLVNGKMPGTISMFVWDRSGGIKRYNVIIQRDLSRLSEQLKQLFPAETIEVRANGKSAVLSGTVSSKDVADKAAAIATSFIESKELVSLLQVRDGAPSNQVLLRVRFAEVSRSAMTELGLGLFTSPTGVKNTLGRVTTEQFPAPSFSELASTKQSSDFGSAVTSASGKFTFSDFLNLFLYSEKFDLGLAIKALQTKGLFQSLAEPNLVAESGKDASFLAGGEFPIPIAQSSGGGTSISVQFKEFGIRLNFTPTVNGNRVHLKVRPEVSTLDFNNAVTLNGFRIPALSTRRTETELELDNHQTFAIAGLINNTMISSMQKVPGIGDIPILGLLFRSKAAQKDQTELVVMITPEILPNNSRGVTPNLPRLAEPYLPPLSQKKSIESPPAAYPPASGTTAADSVPTPGDDAKLSPAAAAATIKGLSPGTRTVVHTDPVPAKTNGTPAAPQGAPTTSASRPLSAQERQAIERARKEERERGEAAMRAKAAETKRQAQQSAQQRLQQRDDEQRQAKLAHAQAQRDAEAARRAAEQSKEQAKRQGEIDRKQAEIDARQQKAIAEAEARVKAAEEAYQAELAKKSRP